MTVATLSPAPVHAHTTSAPKTPSLFERLTGRNAVFACMLFAFVYLAVPRSMSDPDIWWHLRNAQLLLTQHAFIRHDTFSYTAAGAPWINHEWLAELPFYFGWHFLGATGVYLITVLTIEAIMFSVYALAIARSRNHSASLIVTAIATLLATVSFGPRTLLFGWLCLLAQLAILQASTRRSRLLWLLPPLYALWVNTHGSWVIGLVVLGLWIIAGSFRFRAGGISSNGFSPRHLRTLVAASLASVAALFLNPYGWRLVAYPFNLAFHQKLNIANVEEWRSLDFHSPRGKIMLACLLALAVWQLLRNREWKLTELALVALGLYSGLTYSRFLFLFAILAAPIVAAKISTPVRRRPHTSRRLVNFAVILLLAAVCWSQLRHPRPMVRAEANVFPSAASLRALASIPPSQHVLNDYLWGGFLILNAPNTPVFIDSRVDIFEYNGTLKDYLDITHFNDTLRLLDQHQIRYVFFPANAPLVYLLRHTSGWRTDFDRDGVVLLERTSASLPPVQPR